MSNLAVLYFVAFCVGDTSAQVSQAIRNACDSNINSISSAEIAFSYSVGSCSHIESALAGKWTEHSEATGFLAFDGSSVRYDRLYPLSEMALRRQRKGENRYVSPLQSIRLLTDGAATFYDVILPSSDEASTNHSIQIFRGPEVFYKNATFYCGVGGTIPAFQGLSSYVERAASSQSGVRLEALDDKAVLNGRNVARLAFVTPKGRATFWVDVERGAMTVRAEITRDRTTATISYDDFRLLENGCWFPFRELAFLNGGMTFEYKINSIKKLNCKIDESAFSLSFPKPVAVINQAEMVRHPPQRDWSLLHLPRHSAPGTIALTPREPNAAAASMPGEIEQKSRWGLIAVILGLSVVAVAVAVQHARRRNLHD
jgi:hypothetical protein